MWRSVTARISLLSWVAAAGAVAATPIASPPALGHISFPTSGSPQAQPLFVQGVLLLHNFEYDDAIAAFRDAERADPGFAMAYWGEAMSFNQPLWYNENLDKARAALARLGPTPAARAAKAPTAREKRYLQAVERLFGAGDKPTRDLAYADQMATLSRDYPDDDEAAAFYALALLATNPPDARSAAISLKAGAIAMAILKKNPQHPGAAHYALHAYDDGEHASLGLEAARIYARIAPASSHARHMPSHVFLPLGMWDEAATSDEAAFAASVEHAAKHGLSAAQQDFHALSWLQYEYLQQGRFAKARALLDPVRRAMAAETLRDEGRMPMPEHQPVESEIGRGFGATSLKAEAASMRARWIVESGRWEEMRGQGSFDNVDELFALGLASAKLGDLARAAGAFDQLQGASRAAPDAINRELADIMAEEVAGLIHLGRGERPQALATLAQVAAREARMPKPIARPFPIKPATELYAEVLLATGDAAGAVRAFRASLARTPRRASSLIGLARASRGAHLEAEAGSAAKEFLRIWHLADTDRPELAEARGLAQGASRNP